MILNARTMNVLTQERGQRALNQNRSFFYIGYVVLLRVFVTKHVIMTSL